MPSRWIDLAIFDYDQFAGFPNRKTVVPFKKRDEILADNPIQRFREVVGRMETVTVGEVRLLKKRYADVCKHPLWSRSVSSGLTQAVALCAASAPVWADYAEEDPTAGNISATMQAHIIVEGDHSETPIREVPFSIAALCLAQLRTQQVSQPSPLTPTIARYVITSLIHPLRGA